MTARDPRAVFDDHLHQAVAGTIDEDLSRNYADDVVFLTGFGVFERHDGARALHARLTGLLPNPKFTYHTREVRGEMAFLEWSAESDGGRVRDGADSYLIRGGRIEAQTIHYTVEPAAASGRGG